MADFWLFYYLKSIRYFILFAVEYICFIVIWIIVWNYTLLPISNIECYQVILFVAFYTNA